MAVNMNTVNAYNAYQNNYNSAVREKKQDDKTQKANAAEKSHASYVTNGQKQLSKAAQELLEKLRSEHADKDIMVADFDKGDDAQEILSRGTKEFSVLFSSEELEKMAADEKYYNEKMASLDGAIRMSEEINAKYGFERGFGEEGTSDGGVITKFGISFNSDGSTSFFAELEKSSEKQRERIEQTRENKAAEKKESREKADKAEKAVKRVWVQAATEEELFKQISEIDWSNVKEETPIAGAKFDYTV